MTVIRQSTTRTIIVGPILDVDGVAKTDEVVASIKVTKNGTVGAANGATTLTHDHTGKYKLAMNAGDSDTVGVLEISLDSGANIMPVKTLTVLEEAAYDAVYAPAATGDTTGAAATLADTNELQTDNYPASIAAIKAETALIVADTSELQADWVNGGRLDTLLDTTVANNQAGVGSVTCDIYSKTSGHAPIDGVEVWITSDEDGNDVVAGTITSDAMGLTTFYLDVGTYYVWRQLGGYCFTNPQTLNVT